VTTLGQAFAKIDTANRSLATDSDEDHVFELLKNEKSVKKLALLHVTQMNSDSLTPEQALQLVKNLVFLGKCLIPFMEKQVSQQEIVESEQEDISSEGSDAEEQETIKADGVRHSRSGLELLTLRLAGLARQETAKSRGPLIVSFVRS
jgi:U3 small nucleolar RNA-associated protein 20